MKQATSSVKWVYSVYGLFALTYQICAKFVSGVYAMDLNVEEV
jgi:hypothetical protein